MDFLKRFAALALATLLVLSLAGCVEEPPAAPTAPTISYTPHTCPEEDPYQGVSKADFYADYTPACCYQDALHRSSHGFLSGSLDVPGQYAQEADTRPQIDGKFVRNTSALYLDEGNTYVVVDHLGNEVIRIFRGGGYITLEEVAAYMYAFGGDLQYYEMDIGTTGTATPGFAPKPYVQNGKITRGAGRLVYARQDLNKNGLFEEGEIYVFYTHNHYNDFQEYLNYYGGWGQMFGNITGGGEYSSKTNCNPTPYPETAYAVFAQLQNAA